MNESMLRAMSDDELLRYADRGEPQVRELCNRLERVKEQLETAYLCAKDQDTEPDD